MSGIETVESAFEALAEDVVAFAGNRSWDRAGGKYGVLNKMVSCEWWIENLGERDERGEVPPSEINRKACAAVRFVRDRLLTTTSRRIWGLAFTLYPDGKYDIDYDYNKPEGYEETDEVITGEHINQSLPDNGFTAPVMTVEDAYRAIAYCVMDAQGDSSWDRGGVELEYKPGRQALMRFWQERADSREKAPAVPEQAAMVSAVDAAYVLYDDLSRDGGATPAGLSFSLTPAGKMKLDYHYP